MHRFATSAAVVLLLAGIAVRSVAAETSEIATPVAAVCAAEEAVQSDADVVAAAVEQIFACLAARDHQAAANLVTRTFAETALGLPADADVAAHLAGFFPFALESIGTVQMHADGRLSAEVVYRREEGQHMLVRERWIFVRQGDDLLLDAAESLPVELDDMAIEIDANMTGDGFALSRTMLPAGPAVRFAVTNQRSAGNHFAVFALPAGIARKDVLMHGLLEGHRFMGAVFVAARARGELVLVDLKPGNYVVASSAGEAAGTPAGFTVR